MSVWLQLVFCTDNPILNANHANSSGRILCCLNKCVRALKKKGMIIV
jgi:hypothetical protein